MNIDSTIIGGALGLANLTIGIFLKYLFDTLKRKVDQDEHDGTIQRLERDINDRVHVGHCGLKEEMTDERFNHVGALISSVSEHNRSDHDELKTGVREVKDDVKATSEALAQINKCLALLAERIENKNIRGEK